MSVSLADTELDARARAASRGEAEGLLYARNLRVYDARFAERLTFEELGRRFAISAGRARQIVIRVGRRLNIRNRLHSRARGARPIEFPGDRRNQWLEYRPGDPL